MSGWVRIWENLGARVSKGLKENIHNHSTQKTSSVFQFRESLPQAGKTRGFFSLIRKRVWNSLEECKTYCRLEVFANKPTRRMDRERLDFDSTRFVRFSLFFSATLRLTFPYWYCEEIRDTKHHKKRFQYAINEETFVLIYESVFAFAPYSKLRGPAKLFRKGIQNRRHIPQSFS